MAGVAKVGVAVVERAGAVVPAIAVLEAFGISCLSTNAGGDTKSNCYFSGINADFSGVQ